MRWVWIIVAFMSLWTGAVQAQTSATAVLEAIKRNSIETRLNLAHKAVSLTAATEAFLKIQEQFGGDPMTAQLLRGITVDEVHNMAVITMAQAFTTAELEEIIAFHETPAGQAMKQKLPEVQKKIADFVKGRLEENFGQVAPQLRQQQQQQMQQVPGMAPGGMPGMPQQRGLPGLPGFGMGGGPGIPGMAPGGFGSGGMGMGLQ